jgi:hypothetical protein
MKTYLDNPDVSFLESDKEKIMAYYHKRPKRRGRKRRKNGK